ncbi:cupredoxin domain-containing protein [Actinomadura barringtoniae]|uniref:Cupredoxin domain-containing protein n=1 Tax=Actinomadura barringtoniae TaxID=1427535 RepID=A0A939PHX9_9ACTN|nr:plastocyanin/azurin family copper-binding protein [Actinomadura barringtoniae]MBO2452970.1 cupredoxin domain-containing protein [Actinomadura barringtoniae]
MGLRALARAALACALCAPPLLVASPARAAAPTRAAAATVRVQMKGSAFSPATVSVRAGDTVIWTNLDQVPHDVVTTSGPQSVRGPLLQRGRSWSFTFRTPGTYSYYCSIHPDMRAQAVVRESPTSPAQTPAPTPTTTAHGKHSAAAKPSTASATPAPTASAMTPMPQQQAPQSNEAATTPQKSVNPLLPIAGLVCAIAVFCLLLLTSAAGRPDHD